MADDRSRLEKLLNMLAADDMTALVAVRKLRDMANEEKKTVGQLCMTGRIEYKDRVVYRDRERPTSHDDFKRNAEDFTQNFYRNRQSTQDEAAKARQARREEEARNREEARRRDYGGAFDDAEMTDEQREAARTRRRERQERRDHFRRPNSRLLLDELVWAYENNNEDLTFWEIEFAQTVPYQYDQDWELSNTQKDVIRRIIKKVKTNRGQSPI